MSFPAVVALQIQFRKLREDLGGHPPRICERPKKDGQPCNGTAFPWIEPATCPPHATEEERRANRLNERKAYTRMLVGDYDRG